MPRKESVTVFAPATVANVACAFDVLGFAVEQPGDKVTLSIGSEAGIHVRSITGDGGRLPRDARKNTAAVAAEEALKIIGIGEYALDIHLEKEMPLGSGLGSSAASAVAAALAVHELYGAPLTRESLLPAILEGERIACGAAHADNGAPSLLGGFVLIRSYQPLDTIRIAAPNDLFACIVHPHIEIRTEDARRVLKREISLKSAVVQWGNTAGLIAGLLTSDYPLIGRSLEDVIIEPERALLIPGFSAVKKAALDSGALGCSISGSGPSIFSLCLGSNSANCVATAMAAQFSAIGIDSDIFVSPINDRGAYVAESRP